MFLIQIKNWDKKAKPNNCSCTLVSKKYTFIILPFNKFLSNNREDWDHCVKLPDELYKAKQQLNN